MRLVAYVDHFPALSETFVVDEVAALRRAGHGVRVETAAWARYRARLVDPPRIDCLADDGLARRAADLLWLAATRPRAVLGDLRGRRRWRHEEEVRPLRVLAPMVRRLHREGESHVHVNFAGSAALDALRFTRLAGVTYSVTAHAYEIYRAPANLGEKLAGARLAAGVCDATVADLRLIAPGARIEKIVMGVDVRRFRRTQRAPGARVVVAVGRLVEKKGFRHLLEAAALLRDRGAPLDALILVGDGPLRADLEARARDLGLREVTFAGAVDPSGVADFLEAADVLAVPSVVASDGDRDALPVVVQEALAMELPVVGSDLAGLPEVVRPPWGVLAAPGDAAALAGALASVLERSPDERARMGAAARLWVAEQRSVDASARRLAGLIAQSTGVR